MPHFTKEELERFRHDEGSFFRNLRINLHLKRCAHCRAVLATLQEEDLFIEELRDSLQLFQSPPHPAKK